MQRPKEYFITTSGTSNPIPLDRYVNGYGITVIASSTYTLQYSNSDPNYDIQNSPLNGLPVRYSNSYNVSGKWLNWDDPLFVNASSPRSTNFAFPARALRIVNTDASAGSPIILQLTPMGMDAA